MKSIVFGYICLLASASTLAAQSSPSAPLRAEIPSPFFVGDKLLPAGDYRFTPWGTALAVVSDQRKGETAFVLKLPALAKVDREKNLVVFNKYGDGRMFLTQVIHSGSAIASETIKGKRERESVTTTLHSSNHPTTVTIVAMRQ